MRRWLKRSLYVLFGLLLLLPVALLGLLGSESGTRWLLSEALQRSAEEWQLDEVRGDLLSALELDGLSWRSGETALAVRSARLAWAPGALLGGLLHIEELRVEGVRFNAPVSAEPEPEPDTGPPSIPELPLAVQVDRLHVEDVQTDVGGSRFELLTADLATHIEDRTVRIDTLAASAPAWKVAASGEVETVAPFPFRLRLDWQAQVPGTGTFVGGGDFEGDTERVEVTHELSAPFTASVAGSVDIDGLDSRGRLEARWDDLLIPLADGELRSRHGGFEFKGGADDLTLALGADLAGPGFALDAASLSVTGSVQPEAPHALNLAFAWEADLGAEPAAVAEAVLAGGGSVSGDLDRLRVDHGLSAPFRLTTTANLGLAAEPMTLAVAGGWQGLRWPLTGDAEFRSESGEYDVEGDLAHIDYKLGADLAALAADLSDGRLDVEGQADLAPPFAFDAALAWRLRLPESVGADVVARGDGKASGDMDAIDIDHALREPFAFTTGGRVQPASEEALLDIEGDWQGLRWPLAGDLQVSSEGEYSARGGLGELVTEISLGLAGPSVPLAEARVNASATLALDEGFDFDAKLDWGGRLPEEDLAVRAEASAKGDLSRIEFDHRLASPFAVNTGGSVELAGEAPVLDVRGGWREARWPLGGETPDYESSSGDVRLTGTPEDYRVELDAELGGRDLPPVTARVELDGSSSDARIAKLRLDTLGGAATLSGDVAWSPEVVFDLALTGRDLDPGQQWRDWAGNLGFDVAANGRLADAGPEVTVSRLSLDGRLRGYPLSASGNARVAGSRVQLPSLKVRSGDNRLTLEGVIDQQIALDFELDAPQLSALWPGLDGELRARGAVSGSQRAPRVKTTLRGDALRFEQNTLARLELEADVDVAGGTDSRIALDIADATLAGETVNTIKLAASGGPSAHEATLSADAALADLSLSLRGALGDSGWRGNIEGLDVAPTDADPWRLKAPAGLRIDGEGETQLERLCLGQGDASLCALFAQAADGVIDGSLDIRRLPMAVAGPWLPPDIAIDGSIDASATVTGTAAAPRAAFSVTPPPGSIIWSSAGREPLRVDWQDFRIEGGFRDDALSSDLRVELGELGRIAARVKLGAATASDDRALDGRIDAGINDLSIAAAFAPQIAEPAGRIDIGADLGGTLSVPRINGGASFSDGAVKLPDLGLSITDINLEARNRGTEAMVFDGIMSSGGGVLRLGGELALDAGRGFPLSLDIKGDVFEVARLPEAQVFASPDLSLRRSAEATRLSGSVEIPEATLRVREVPVSAVSVSSDEVVVQERYQETETAMAVGINLELLLGDKVRFTGFGLDTRLNGRMRVTAEADEPLVGEGTIRLLDGFYQAYGQDLAIERGRLLFAGPLDNPGLDVRAVRDTGAVKAGIQVTGTASNLRATVFSEPPLPEADALSYLLTGRGLNSASGSDGAMLSSAAMALGLDNAEVLSQKIGRQLGLDDVGIETSGEDAGLRLGKYLTPDLYLSYVLSLFGGEGAVQLDYQLTDRISVQGRSGTESQEVDLLYEYERD